ncbi:MAG TPA: hypothetical protein VJZ76_12780 [Thermoanaerobaculia bacterium]|nr:hypothetical protein [Thermoanaerobaculia bacterium]
MSPGARMSRPGSMTVMKNDNAPARAVELLNQTLDAMERDERAPTSPVSSFQNAKVRRELRRRAARLRKGLIQPRYTNLHTAEELADMYERTARRDEILEEISKDIRRIWAELRPILDENDPEVARAIIEFLLEIERTAEANGAGSEADARYRRSLRMWSYGYQARDQRRRQRVSAPRPICLATDPYEQVRMKMIACERLPSPPSSGETVISIPAEGKDSGRERIFLRIGACEFSWIGSFERGHTCFCSTVQMMPDRKHMFVMAGGAGYIVDAKSRALVETIGTKVIGVMSNRPRTLFFVNHGDTIFEAFGESGRLWKTAPIGSGGFRELALTDDALVGEARHPSRAQWVEFSVSLDTGEVCLDAETIRRPVAP